MRIFTSSLFFLSLLGLQGCATSPTSLVNAKQAPSDRLLALQAQSETTGTLIVTRDTGFMGGGCYLSVSLNGTLAARLDVGEKSTFYVPPGEVLIRAGRDPEGRALCSTDQGNWTQRETNINAGETKYFRLSIDANGKPDIQRSE